MATWVIGLRASRPLAAAPQVTCKLSGLITEADREHWTVEDLRAAVDELLASFGPERLMFGSDWPVCVVAGGWARWASAAEELLSPLSADELDDVLYGTAVRAYGLQVDGGTVSPPRSDRNS